MTPAEIGQIVGVHADTVGKWLKLKDKEVTLRKRGRKPGAHRLLAGDQEHRFKKLIIDKTPDQLKIHYAVLAQTWSDNYPFYEQLEAYFEAFVISHSWETVKIHRYGIQFFYKHVLKQ